MDGKPYISPAGEAFVLFTLLFPPLSCEERKMFPQASVTSSPKIGLAVVLSVLFACLLYTFFFHKKSFYPLPPGPPGKFLVGNLGQLSDHPEQDYIRWGKEYDSDVIYVNVLGQPMICLNSVKAATDLLDKRGSNYCDRPRFTLFEVMGWGFTLTFLRWGPRFKLHRRLFQATFSQTSLQTFRPMQTAEARRAVHSLLPLDQNNSSAPHPHHHHHQTQPSSWLDTTLLLTTSVIFRIAYGQPVHSRDSPYVAMARAANAATTNGGIAGSTVADKLPPLVARCLFHLLPSRCAPAALRHARASRGAIRRIHEVPWNDTLRDIEGGTARPSFMKMHYERWRAANDGDNGGGNGDGEKQGGGGGKEMQPTLADLKGATAAVFIAGGNSTWGMILAALLFLTKYPAVQARIIAELDTVLLTNTRLPAFADRPRLPYLEAFLLETMRSLPLNPLVIPHRTRNDDVYEGMFIPAGTVVFANTKAMCSDPGVYRDPDAFEPARYAAARGEPAPVGNFGFGRRRCPGNHLALGTVWVFVATLLSVFEVQRVVDERGVVVEPEVALTVGLGGHPVPFQCQLKVRSPERAALLREDETFGEE